MVFQAKSMREILLFRGKGSSKTVLIRMWLFEANASLRDLGVKSFSTTLEALEA
jgi:hypothetical protein